MKKIISLALVAALLTTIFVIAASASALSFSVRIEGVTKNIYDSNLDISSEGSDPIEYTVGKALQYISDNDESITIEGIADNYISSVNGEQSGQYGDYAGWYYSVNGVVPDIGINDYKLQDGDSVVLFYGDYPCQVPVLDLKDVENGVIKVQSYDSVWYQDELGEWKSTSDWAPVAGAKLSLNEYEYTSDENGIVNFDRSKFKENDTVYAQISKYSDKGAPQVLRFAKGYNFALGAVSGETQPATVEPTAPVTEPVTEVPPTTESKDTVVSVPADKTLYRGQTFKINAEIKNPVGKTSYISNRKSIASVNKSGKVTARKKGTATITVKNNGVSKKFKVTVKNPKLNKKSITLKKGKTFKIKITGKAGTQKYKSSKKSVAKVSKKGKITAKKKGKATITVTTNGGYKLKIKVKVK